MATLKDVARYEADTIREGIGWTIVWKTGRSWNSTSIWLNPDTDKFCLEDMEAVTEALEQDPNAVMLNGYYCGHFAEDMRANEIAQGIRWHYENGYNLLKDSAAFPQEPIERPADLPEYTPQNQKQRGGHGPEVSTVYNHQYPNLVAEIGYKNAGSLYNCATYAGVSVDVLEGFLLGDNACNLSASEIDRLVEYVKFSFNGVLRSPDYLLSSKLGYYIPAKPKHQRKLRLIWAAVEAAREINPTITLLGKRISEQDDLPSFIELCKMKIVPAALVNHAKEFVGDVYTRQCVSEQIYHPIVRALEY